MTTRRTKDAGKKAASAIAELSRQVSVAVPLGPNREAEITRLMEAVKAQTTQPGEIIVEEGSNPYVNRNKAWRRAKGSIIWFLDSDVIPDPDALEKALEIFAQTNPEGVEGHIYGIIQRVFRWGFMSGHIFYTRKALEKVGGFDERFTDWRGDTDLGWSILDGGGLILYQPLSRAFHPAGSNTQPNLETERLLYDKHPALYREAREKGYLQCFIHD
ncbi:MAG TPA: glycosyltransferase family A protein [bacterium]|nr:glycosyltransferase family A protein [bacterium]HQJ66310.1 glycosyltransferase family A protein [bacterium]